ncbi:hypothetical protein [Thiocystis minor]|uniref:hypothetical protein n=1 Tax=Thiocystis minor TaxID=61597 RepID=UPI001F5C2C83|nr:hypothetical protein [Thiocystis minor]
MEAENFSRLISALMRTGAYPHPADPVEHIETHISHVLLAGDFAYKLKKPLDLGFLDFSTLELRRHFCEEELRLNRRLAEDLYLEVVAVTGTPTAPRIGGAGPALEYAVKMRRFPQESLLDRQPLASDLMTRLAEEIADFHARIPVADRHLDFGSPDAVLMPMLENLTQVRARGHPRQSGAARSARGLDTGALPSSDSRARTTPSAWLCARVPWRHASRQHRAGRWRDSHLRRHRVQSQSALDRYRQRSGIPRDGSGAGG